MTDAAPQKATPSDAITARLFCSIAAIPMAMSPMAMSPMETKLKCKTPWDLHWS
jgi:hypothetical protein